MYVYRYKQTEAQIETDTDTQGDRQNQRQTDRRITRSMHKPTNALTFRTMLGTGLHLLPVTGLLILTMMVVRTTDSMTITVVKQ